MANRKIQLVLPYFIDTRGQPHPQLLQIARNHPEMSVISDKEHNPYYVETRNERYISADRWGVTPEELEAFVRSEGPNFSYSTPSSFALGLWRNYFYPHDYIIPTDGFRGRMIHDALYGGRCEVYRYGEQHLYQYDINSSYPYSATQIDFPDPHSIEYVPCPTREYIDTHEGVSRVVFSQGGDIPPLPVRIWGRVVYPIADHLTGTYTHNELRYAMSVGVEIHSIERQYIATAMVDNPFSDYVGYCYARRGDSKVWKRILNVLFGRLAVQGSTLLRFRVAHTRQELLDTPRYLKNYFGANMIATEFSPPPEGNTLWSALVLGHARTRLHHYAAYAVYLDTDCFMSLHDVSVPISGALGDWKLREGDYDIRGAKSYRLATPGGEDIIKLKGIPLATRSISDFLRTRATQERVKLPDGGTVPYNLNQTSLSNMSEGWVNANGKY